MSSLITDLPILLRPFDARTRQEAERLADDDAVRGLELLEDEMIRCLGLLGLTSLRELDKSCLHPATVTNLPSVFSAFPLLDVEPYRY